MSPLSSCGKNFPSPPSVLASLRNFCPLPLRCLVDYSVYVSRGMAANSQFQPPSSLPSWKWSETTAREGQLLHAWDGGRRPNEHISRWGLTLFQAMNPHGRLFTPDLMVVSFMCKNLSGPRACFIESSATARSRFNYFFLPLPVMQGQKPREGNDLPAPKKGPRNKKGSTVHSKIAKQLPSLDIQ